MLVGDRFKENGKTFEVTAIINDTNYSFREVKEEPAPKPVFNPTFEEEVKEEVKKESTVKRGRKKV